MNNGIGRLSLGLSDFGLTESQLEGELKKALVTGNTQGGDIGNPNNTNASALRPESLEYMIKSPLFKAEHIKLWKYMPKLPVDNTLFEYNLITKRGSDTGSYFSFEGETPEDRSSAFLRQTGKVKFLTTQKAITHPATVVKNAVPGTIMSYEIQQGMLDLLQKANRSVCYGSEYTSQAGVEASGLFELHLDNLISLGDVTSLNGYIDDSGLVVDMRGATLKQGDISSAAVEVQQSRYAFPNTLVCSHQVHQGLSLDFQDKQRILLGGPDNTKNFAGSVVPGIEIIGGTSVNIFTDIFMDKSNGNKDWSAVIPASDSATHAKAPVAPVPDGVTPVAVVPGQTDSKFADGIGSYHYAVAAKNRYGRSAAVAMTAGGAAAVANATDAVDLKFAAGSGTYAPSSYIIYRSVVDNTGAAASATRMFPIMEIAATGSSSIKGSLANGVDGAAASTVRDKNRYLPNTEEAYLTNHSTEVYSIKQLLPPTMFDLAFVSLEYRKALAMYYGMALYIPTHFVRFINVGKAQAFA